MTQFHLYNAELTIRESALSIPILKDHFNRPNIRKLQDLNAVLTTIENWLAIGSEIRIIDWVGMTVEMFSQFTHFMLVLFKLTTLNEPGWDLQEVKRRADVFAVLDHYTKVLELVPVEADIVDTDGPRRGMIFKGPYIIRAIKALFLMEIGEEIPQTAPTSGIGCMDAINEADNSMEAPISEDFLWALAEEPWLSELFTSTWDMGQMVDI
jgi:hypothetical protein